MCKEDAIHIKSKDLCERCLYDLDNDECQSRYTCEGCEQHEAETRKCKCVEIRRGTPCEYFKEASDE